MLVRNSCTHDARVLKEARTLGQAGHRVTVIAIRAVGVPQREEREGFVIERVSVNPPHYWLLDGGKGRAKRELRQNGPPTEAETTPIPTWARRAYRRGSGFTHWLHQALLMEDYGLRVLPVASKLNPQVIHSHDFHTLPVGWMLSRLMDAKLVYDSHELALEAGSMSGLKGWRKQMLRVMEAELVRQSDVVITVNASIAGILRLLYGVDVAVVANYPHPPTGRDRDSRGILRTRLNLDNSVRIVLYQGGLAEGRGLEGLIRASQRLQRVALVLLGWGPLERALRALTEELGVADRVHFLPPVSQDDLLPYSSDADVGVIPYQPVSLNNRLATPNKLFEYMMAGVPVAASNLPEMARIVEGEGIGATFDPYSDESLAGAVSDVLNSPNHKEMRRHAREAALARYTWMREGRNLVALYEQLEERRQKVNGTLEKGTAR